MILYHATYRSNLPSIKKLGLGAKQPKNWDFSETGVICLATDPEVAFSYAETADEVPDYKYESGIIVLAVQSEALARQYVAKDNNIQGDSGEQCYTYKGVINPAQLYVATRKGGLLGKLLMFKRVPSYE